MFSSLLMLSVSSFAPRKKRSFRGVKDDTQCNDKMNSTASRASGECLIAVQCLKGRLMPLGKRETDRVDLSGLADSF